MRPVPRAVVAGALTVTAYLGVVVATTPALEPLASIRAAFALNSIIIIGMGAGIGLQVYVSGRARTIGCRLDMTLGGNTGSTAATSFFSFFSLVPLGCCGWWLYVLSLLPSVVGTGASAILIEYSQLLAYGGLAAVFAFAGMSAYRLRQMTAVS